MRSIRILLLCGVLCTTTTGCAAIVGGLIEGAIDGLVESKQERRIRRDYRRKARGEPLKYFKDCKALHRADRRERRRSKGC